MSRPVSGAIPALDGIRAIAVAMVFFAHSGLEHLVPGGLGVTVFFVLSGYLITTLMRIEYESTGRIDFRAFYLRRVLRLMPPLVVVVAAAGLLAHFGVIGGGFTWQGLLSVLFYFGNYHMIANDFAGVPLGIGVVWSLAVEEHFYLLYPPLAWLLLQTGRPRTSALLLAALCLAVLAWRWTLIAQGAPEPRLTMGTDTRVDAILAGCVMALLRNPWLDPVPAPNLWRDTALGLGCGALLLFTLLVRDPEFRLGLRYTLQSLAIAPLIWLAVARAQYWPMRWLESRPLRWLGTVSYSVYLSHQVIQLGIERNWPQLGWIGSTLLAVILTLLVAEAMRRWVELPSLRLRRRLRPSNTPAATGTAADIRTSHP